MKLSEFKDLIADIETEVPVGEDPEIHPWCYHGSTQLDFVNIIYLPEEKMIDMMYRDKNALKG